MFKLSNNLVVREDDKSMFSLDKMEIYEFNDAGFAAIMIIHNAGESGISFESWHEKAIRIPDFIDETDDFWHGLIDHGIVIVT